MAGADRKGTSDCADEVILSLKGAKSPTRGRKLRSTGTKARPHVSNGPNSLVELKKQLEVRTRELAEAYSTHIPRYGFEFCFRVALWRALGSGHWVTENSVHIDHVTESPNVSGRQQSRLKSPMEIIGNLIPVGTSLR